MSTITLPFLIILKDKMLREVRRLDMAYEAKRQEAVAMWGEGYFAEYVSGPSTITFYKRKKHHNASRSTLITRCNDQDIRNDSLKQSLDVINAQVDELLFERDARRAAWDVVAATNGIDDSIDSLRCEIMKLQQQIARSKLKQLTLA